MRIESEKLQSVMALVSQHPELLPSNTSITPAQQFRKLVIKRLLAENILVFLLQYIGLKLTSLIVHPSPLWFATGTACAYLFLRGYSVLPGIWLGSFLSFYLEQIGFLLAFEYATVLTLQGLLLLWFSYRYLSPTLIFHRLQLFMQFIIFTIILTGITSFLLMGICYFSLYQAAVSLQLWLQWWLANFNGILIFSCALITWDAYFPDFQAVKQSKSTVLLFGLLLFFIMVLIFSHTAVSTSCLVLLIILLTALISARFGWCGAITTSFLSAIVLCFAELMDATVFDSYSTSSRVLLLQVFMAVNTIIGVSVALGRQKM